MISTMHLQPLAISSSSSFTHISLLPSFPSLCFSQSHSNLSTSTTICKRFLSPSVNGKFATLPFSSTKRLTTRAAEYKFPDPIPEFADSETEKFKSHLLKKLSKRDIYGESVEEVVGVCTEIFSTFLHSEYGGPGTLLVLPFVDMADTLNERGLPGGPQAARAAIKWAQDHVDKDWKEWTAGDSNS
ncbi:protein PLASTID REDOX INSENSITIVE 2, chloroplastic-like [Abrus precatorius]|uniref:Protein PLASTID REDOX INSENSITIVE 2, chloroplastic-like n=1 Tax=Abrus precatorius TaxID=3816 RepID=A0A8B8KS17_ABRPR|nr:protein PLASTID REDOX INSENSITIVE 2, chloroplastic-like [Abrus precatorius]